MNENLPIRSQNLVKPVRDPADWIRAYDDPDTDRTSEVAFGKHDVISHYSLA
jgi:hypothetical protein